MIDFEALLRAVAWRPCDPPADPAGLPFATHTGELRIGTASLRVYRLSDGRRIIDAADLEAFFFGPRPEPPAEGG